MIFTFEREPRGWVHPFYNRRRRCHQVDDWDAFVIPALATVGTLNHLLNLADHDTSTSRTRAEKTSDKFELKLDVQQFKPEELDVKMVDNCLVVEGKHEEKRDEHGLVSRHFLRRYQLPDDVKPDSVTCNLGSDGVLRVSAPRMIEQKPAGERTIPINLTAQSAVTDKMEEKADEEQIVTEKHEKMDDVPSSAEANAA